MRRSSHTSGKRCSHPRVRFRTSSWTRSVIW
jgi:hypothetical protein